MKETTNNLLRYSRATYLRAVEEQKRLFSFNNMQAILGFHDAVEFCLRAITEEFDINLPQNDSVMEIFSVIEKQLGQQQPPRKLPRRTQIRFLDSARGKVKHHASVPSMEDTKECFLHTKLFLEQVSPDYFQVPFEHISLTALVHSVNLRELLYKAEQQIVEKEYVKSLAFSKIAYTKGQPAADLFLGPDNHWRNFRSHSVHTPSIPIRASSGFGSRNQQQIYIDTSGISQAIRESTREAQEIVNAVIAKVDRLERAVVHMMIGGDVLAAKRFEEITPHILFRANKFDCHWRSGKEATENMAQEALEYSTQMILRWQDMGVIQSKRSPQETYAVGDWEEIDLPGLDLSKASEDEQGWQF